MNRSSRLQNKTTKTIRYLFSEIEIFIKLNDFMWLVTSGFVKCDEFSLEMNILRVFLPFNFKAV